ncbi:MAG: hypothetical protein JSV60_05545 [Desulfobacterales bacterium]|nr:MAG: hypothetical protein JSV60_05545 [Desulfobacterales bacterium]
MGSYDRQSGSAPFAVATVLSVFMGGLALGSYLAGKYIDRIPSKRNLLSLYGKVEVAIGIYGLLLPVFTMMAKPFYVIAYNRLFQHFWIYQVFAFLGWSLLLIFPATLMGGYLASAVSLLCDPLRPSGITHWTFVWH